MTLLNEMPALQTATITWDAKVMVSSFTLQMRSHSPSAVYTAWHESDIWECLLFWFLAGFNQKKVQGIDLERKMWQQRQIPFPLFVELDLEMVLLYTEPQP